MTNIFRFISLAALLILWLPQPAPEAKELKVEKIECVDSAGGIRSKKIKGTETPVCRIGDWVRVVVKDLNKWIADNKDRHKVKNLVLSMDGRLLAGSPAYLVQKDTLGFDLVRKQDHTANMEAWRSLLSRSKLFEPKVVSVSIALTGSLKRYGEKEVGISVASTWRLAFIVGILFVLFGLSVWLFLTKNLLRDPGPAPDTGKKPFSLGHSQMAFWSFLTILGFMYVWVVVGDLAVLNPGMLGLIGISAATGLAATSVGKSKQTAAQTEVSKLQQERLEIQTRIKALADLASDAETATDAIQREKQDKESRLTAINTRLGQLESVPVSKGFVLDILGSGDEIEFARLQMLAWTVVLGIVFLHSVFTTLSMPVFDATLLGLMGVSSGTYIGFKFPTTKGK